METKELTDKATLILDKMLDAVNLGVDKAPEFTSELIREYMLYYSIGHYVGVASCLFVLSICAYFFMKGMKLNKYRNDGDGYIFLSTSFGALTFIFLVCLAVDVIRIHVAPKAFLIENIRK
jgi:hypothetical protein